MDYCNTFRKRKNLLPVWRTLQHWMVNNLLDLKMNFAIELSNRSVWKVLLYVSCRYRLLISSSLLENFVDQNLLFGSIKPSTKATGKVFDEAKEKTANSCWGKLICCFWRRLSAERIKSREIFRGKRSLFLFWSEELLGRRRINFPFEETTIVGSSFRTNTYWGRQTIVIVVLIDPKEKR